MTEPLTTRGPFLPGGVSVAWALQSGPGVSPPVVTLSLLGDTENLATRTLTQEEAADLYTQLGQHLENIAPPVNPTKSGVTVPASFFPDLRESNLEAIQHEIDNPLFPPSPAARGQNMIRTSEVEGWTREEREAALRNVTGTRASRADRPTGRRYTISAWLELSKPSED